MPIKRIFPFFILIVAALAFQGCTTELEEMPTVVSRVSDKAEPMQKGPFKPTWKSLEQYECPEWFRDAKFGIWAHWGPQCQPQQGDWYARHMYIEGWDQNKFHVAHYGHPSEFGFKDVIHEWKAEKWDPEKLVGLYKRVGAQYFFAMANHHDNLDMWDSQYQPWNSVAVGPKKNIIAGWAEAAKKHGLRFGVSVHAAHAWRWYESSQGADANGEFAGISYDGKLTKADGKGQWWEGLDPQDLYAQNHELSRDSANPGAIHSQWHWDNGASIPDAAYCEKFYNRTVDLINKYQPDLLYFDDTGLPLWPVSDAGLKIAAHYYNSNMKQHNGRNEAVLFGKILTPQQQQCLVWDVERGALNKIAELPWQTDTCIGGWHYNRSDYEGNRYKSAKTVIHMLADIVSKNGNLLLNIPVRGDGSIDEKEEKILEGIAAWMDINRECIFGTRPWKVFGEGPATEGAPISAQGFNEGKGKPMTAEDVRFTTKGDILYAIVLGQPAKDLQIKSLGTAAGLLDKPIAGVRLLGSDETIRWIQSEASLTIKPVQNKPCDEAIVFRITMQ